MNLYNSIESEKRIKISLYRILGIQTWVSFSITNCIGTKVVFGIKLDLDNKEKFMANAVMRAQSYAVDIEHYIRNVLDCERFGFLGIANSDFIRRNPLAAILATCGYIYARVNNTDKKLIEQFVNETEFYWEMSLDELLSFDTSSKTVGLATVELEYDNGEKALQDLINKFSEICALAE